MKNTFIVGLTGRSGSGKTTVRRFLEQNGIAAIDCDAVTREVQAAGGECLAELVREFTGVILNEDGSLARSKLAELCFSDPSKKRRLDEICHPYILKLLFEKIERLGTDLCVVEAGALFESGLDKDCDRIVAVIASDDSSADRIESRDGIPRESALLRLGAQISVDSIIERSDFVLFNNGSLEQLQERTERLIETIIFWKNEGNTDE